MRFLFLCLLVYLGYRILKGLMSAGQSTARPARHDDLTPIDDIMVQDPVCQTYIPRRDGIKEIINGQHCYFCSKECRDKYMEGVGKTSA